MKKPIDTDAIVVIDRGTDGNSDGHNMHAGARSRHSDRRHFMRTGGAIMLAGAAAAVSGNAMADCDSPLGTGQKNPNQAGSDSDTGASGDRNGCGRKSKKPKMTGTVSNTMKPRIATPVVKIPVVK